MEKKKVLAIDDELDFLKIVRLNLEGTGKYEVLTLSSAKNTISQVHTFKPDVILLDMLIPTIGGIEVCEMLHNDPIGKDIPIIMLSGLKKDKDVTKAYMVGAVDYLIKPVEKDELIAKIENALQFK